MQGDGRFLVSVVLDEAGHHAGDNCFHVGVTVDADEVLGAEGEDGNVAQAVAHFIHVDDRQWVGRRCGFLEQLDRGFDLLGIGAEGNEQFADLVGNVQALLTHAVPVDVVRVALWVAEGFVHCGYELE